MRASLVLPLIALAVAGCVTPTVTDDAPPAASVTRPGLVLDTDMGTITLALYPEFAPETVAHVTRLSEAGFYDGLLWHRVVDDFVIQTGDPSSTGATGSGGRVPLETHPDAFFSAGSVGLARMPDPDSGDSQFFITEKPQPHLHDPRGSTEAYGAFTKFAEVVDGMDVVRAIAAVPVIPGLDRPVEDVHVRSITLTDLALTPEEARALPRQTFEPTDAPGDVHALLDAPLARPAGTRVDVAFFTEDADGARALAEPRVAVGGAPPVALAPLAEDAAVARGTVIVEEAGTHAVRLLDGEREIAVFEVAWTAPDP